MAGFEFRYRLSGAAPTIQELTFKDTETLTKGDLVNLESGQIDLAATNDAAIVGVALETLAGTTAVSKLRVITDKDAVYGVTDANARLIGANLDISGTVTGTMGVTTASNNDVIVVANSSATEETLVRIATGESWQD